MNSAEGGGALDVSIAAAQFFDASTWITLGAALLVSTAAFVVVMRLYASLVMESCSPNGKLVAAIKHPASPTDQFEIDALDGSKVFSVGSNQKSTDSLRG
jgi:hypothetical protein